MENNYSSKVLRAIDLIWQHFDSASHREGFNLLVEAAREDDADAFCFLGRCYLGPEYVRDTEVFESDDEKGLELIRESVRRGSATGVLVALRCGALTPSLEEEMPFANLREAFEKVMIYAQSGSAFAMYVIGNAWYWGDLLLICPELQAKFTDVKIYNAVAWPSAVVFFENTFERGLGLAFGNYQEIYDSGLARIPQTRFEYYFNILADAGDPDICNNYACYCSKQDDNERALKYYIKAAEGGNVNALYNLGSMYYNGEGVEEDSVKAFEYFSRAATQNYVNAFFMLGCFYFEGTEPVVQDYAEAVKWMRLAIENGFRSDWKAAGVLAVCLQNGLGTEQDDDEAFELLEYIVESGNLDNFWSPLDGQLCAALGAAYAFGRGVEKNLATGLEYLEKAIRLGCHEALSYKEDLIGTDKGSNERLC